MGTHFRCPDIQRKSGRFHDPRMAPQPHRILRDAPHHSLRTQTFPGKTALFQNTADAILIADKNKADEIKKIVNQLPDELR